jgi:hypothetical protein
MATGVIIRLWQITQTNERYRGTLNWKCWYCDTMPWRKRKQSLLGNGPVNTLATIEETQEVVISMRSMPMLHNKEQRQARVTQTEEFSITCYMYKMYIWWKPSILIRDKPIFSSERMLHKDYYFRDQLEKENLWSWVSRNLTPRWTDWW